MSTKVEPPSASEQIRQEVRKLAGTGVNLTDKATRVAKAKELATKYKVDYNTAVKAYDKALKDAGQQPPSQPPASTKTTGGIKTDVQPSPKKPQEGVKAEPAAGAQAPLAGVRTPEQKAADVAMFTELIKAASTGLYGIAEGAWGVKLAKPEASSYTLAGQMWADVFEAYGWETPKVLLLIGAGAYTAQLVAMPLLAGRTEYLRKLKAQKEGLTPAAASTPPPTKEVLKA